MCACGVVLGLPQGVVITFGVVLSLLSGPVVQCAPVGSVGSAVRSCVTLCPCGFCWVCCQVLCHPMTLWVLLGLLSGHVVPCALVRLCWFCSRVLWYPVHVFVRFGWICCRVLWSPVHMWSFAGFATGGQCVTLCPCGLCWICYRVLWYPQSTCGVLLGLLQGTMCHLLHL
jgi:hypothetical protein